MIYTIGHGNRPLDELTGLLQTFRIGCLVDVRAFPGSRRHPHFGRAALEQSLPAAGVEYIWEGASLGGRRKSRADSPHAALRNASFRAYTNHMQSAAFHEGIERLAAHAAGANVAVMCAERLPWQCHRYMISDYLVAQGVDVRHVIDAGAPREHVLRAEARLSHGNLIYDGNTQADLGIG